MPLVAWVARASQCRRTMKKTTTPKRPRIDLRREDIKVLDLAKVNPAGAALSCAPQIAAVGC